MATAKAPQNKKKANKKSSPVDMVYRYKRAHEKLLGEQSKDLQGRIQAARQLNSKHDSQVEQFIRDVISLAESDIEI